MGRYDGHYWRRSFVLFYAGYIKEIFREKTDNIKNVATVHKSSEDFPVLGEVIFKSYLDKEYEIKKMVNPKPCCPKL